MHRWSSPWCARQAAAALAALALASVTASPAAPKPPPDPRDPRGATYVEGEILVKFRSEAPAASRLAVRREAAAVVERRFASGAELWRLGSGLAVPEALAHLKETGGVEYAEPNYLLHAARTPDDPFFPQQYALANTGQAGGASGADIDAAAAWDISTGDPSVLVAILDTGLDLDHPDLAPNLWTNPDEIPGNLVDDDGNGLVDDVHGWDFANHDAEPRDDLGHGTHVAGTIAAAGNNGVGVAGVAWRAGLMPLKILDQGGSGTTSDALQAIDYAAAHGARILNASWGGNYFSMAMLEAIRDAGSRHDVLVVAAAGNDGDDSDRVGFFPAGFDSGHVIAVAATDRRDQLAAFSNYGRTTVDVAAPGVEIYSTLPGGGYGLSSGTSMATPHVSGVAALILGFAPGMGAASLRRRILDQAEPIAGLVDKVATAGRVNAFRCLLGAERNPPGPVADLRVVEPLSDGLVLAWTASGDDHDSGAAAAYDLRVSETPFDASGFDAAPRVGVPGAPLPAGSPETKEIGGIEPSRTYTLGLRAVDEWGNAGAPVFATATTRPPPAMETAPASVSAALGSGRITTTFLMVSNTTEGTLDWSLERAMQRPRAAGGGSGTERWGGPDGFGYAFHDSDEPEGPVFAWRDIAAIGRSAFISGDDPISDIIPIGFAFPFYGETFTSLRIASNGFLSFTHPEGPYENQPLPSPGAPGNLVAGFWDDLYIPGLQGLLWLAEPHAFTVQYDRVLRYGGGGPYTFQIVLLDSGEILFQYLDMQDLQDSATIGIQDGSGAAGLAIAFDAPYVHDRLAVRLFEQEDWLTAVPRSGRLRSGESASVALTFDASTLHGGLYEGWLPILSNDPARPRVEVPVRLTVGSARAIAIEPAALDFGEVYATYAWRRSIEIVSRGNLPLTVTSVVPDDPAIVADFAPFTLAPGARRSLALQWLPAAAGPLLSQVRIDSDATEAPSVSVSLTGNAVNFPPPGAAAVWPPSQVECTGPGGADVVFDGLPSLPAGGLDIVLYEWIEDPGSAHEALLGTGPRIGARLALGTHRLALRVTDSEGGVGSTGTTITVADTTPPELSVTASPAVLWPPNHRMVPVSVTYSVRDACSHEVPVRLTGAWSSEPDDAPGNADGRTTGDIAGAEAGTPDTSLFLRAERGTKGRIYRIGYVATDAAGLATDREAILPVTAGPGARRR